MSNQTSTGVTQPTREQLAKLAHWQATALERMGYFAPILFAFRPVDAPGLGTFAVDDRMRLYIDFEAVAPKGDRWCAESLLHECGHIWNEHSGRATELGVPMDATARKDWNLATDFAINDDLVEVGCDTLSDMLPKLIGEPDHLTAEHYYGVISNARRGSQQQPKCGQCGQNQGQQGQQGQQGGQSGQQQGNQQGQRCPGCGQGQPQFAGCGSGSGGPAAPCELDGEDLGGYAKGASEVEKDQIRMNTAAAILDFAAKGRGTMPGSFIGQAKQILAPPKVPWQRVLSAALRRATAKSAGKTRTTYTRRNRRRHNVRLGNSPERVIYPARYNPKPNIVVVRDTSGSMSERDLNAVGNEVVGIARSLQVKGDRLRVMDVDAVVHSVTPYRDVESLANVEGRGGTNMVVGIEAAVELDQRPDVIIVMTDGGTPWPTEPVGIPVVACIIDQGSDVAPVVDAVPSWITAVVVDDLGDADQAPAA